jgi:hypothetical protein
MYKPGGTYKIPFEVKNAAQALIDPDAAALPVAFLWYDAAPLGVTCTVARISTGLYSVTFAVPAAPACVLDKTIALRVTTTVGGNLVSGFQALGVLSDASAEIAARPLFPRVQANGSASPPTWDDFAYVGYCAAVCGQETSDTGDTSGTLVIRDWLGNTVKTLVLTVASLGGFKVPFRRV